MAEVRIQGDVTYPERGTRWMDRTDPGRTLHVEVVEPGDRLGREIRGIVSTGGEPRPYAADQRTFEGVWEVLRVPVAKS